MFMTCCQCIGFEPYKNRAIAVCNNRKGPSGFPERPFLYSCCMHDLIAGEVCLDPTVFRFAFLGLVAGYRLGFTIALGGQTLRGNAEFLHEIGPDIDGTLRGKLLVVLVTANIVGMTGYLSLGFREVLEEAAEVVEVGVILGLDGILVSIEQDINNSRLAAETLRRSLCLGCRLGGRCGWRRKFNDYPSCTCGCAAGTGT